MVDDPAISATITAFFALFFLLSGVDQIKKDRMVFGVGSLLLFALGVGILMLDAHQAFVEDEPCAINAGEGE